MRTGNWSFQYFYIYMWFFYWLYKAVLNVQGMRKKAGPSIIKGLNAVNNLYHFSIVYSYKLPILKQF
jgi:hypothetical protein